MNRRISQWWRLAACLTVVTAASTACLGTVNTVEPFEYRVYPVPAENVYVSAEYLDPAYDIISQEAVHGGAGFTVNVTKYVFIGTVQAGYANLSAAGDTSITPILTPTEKYTYVDTPIGDVFGAGKYNLRMNILGCRFADNSPCKFQFEAAQYPFVVNPTAAGKLRLSRSAVPSWTKVG